MELTIKIFNKNKRIKELEKEVQKWEKIAGLHEKMEKDVIVSKDKIIEEREKEVQKWRGRADLCEELMEEIKTNANEVISTQKEELFKLQKINAKILTECHINEQIKHLPNKKSPARSEA